MKDLLFAFILILTACGRSSSPEGRLSMRLEDIQKELESIKKQNAIILDSMGKINEELRQMRQSK